MTKMKSLVIVGLQWGDEGKGKLVDYLSEVFDIVARFQGGSNAGHTVIIGDTVHDFEVAEELGIKSILIADGHQSKKRLEETGALVLTQLKSLLQPDTANKLLR